MDREISMTAELAIGLTALAAVLSFVMFTVLIGKDMQNDAMNTLSDTREIISSNYVEDLARDRVQKDVPAATAYNILTMYSDVIIYEVNSYDDKTRNLQEEGSVLKAHLKGRVYLDIRKFSDGTYFAIVRPLDLNSNYADVTVTGINKFIRDNQDYISSSSSKEGV